MSEAVLGRTPLDGLHRALGARMTPFAGFAMPLQYTSVLAEHEAVRKRAGLFDLSHMAQFELIGQDVIAWADGLTANTIAAMKPWAARYNLIMNEHGGVRDDVIFYRLPDRLFLVANAANADKVSDHLDAHNIGGKIEIRRLHGVRALIAIQGPASVALLQPHVDARLAEMSYYACAHARIEGVPVLIARTGYTGEDGFEIFVDGAKAARIFELLLSAGKSSGVVPVGLAARDMLRLEAGMPLYGHELGEELSPFESGLAWVVKLEKGDFVGRASLRQRQRTDTRRIVGLKLDGRVPAREGYPVFSGEQRIGAIRSASVAPSLGGVPIATALVDGDAAEAGSGCEIEIRGARYPAVVTPMPFYRRQRG